MMYKYFTVLLLLVAIESQSQQVEKSRITGLDPKIKGLNVGDKVPDIFIAKIINNNKAGARISDFKDQLLILDFWDTGCGSCIELLPKLDSLQHVFGKKIKILPITWQKQSEMETFFKTNKYLKARTKSFNLPYVVEDRTLAAHFRHEMISHLVWIYKGVVKAITFSDYVTAENIQMVLDNKTLDWPQKRDAVDFDITKPLISIDKDLFNQKSRFFSYSVLTGQRDGLNKTGGLNFSYDSATNIRRMAFFNKTLVGAYSMLLFNADSVRKEFFITPDRVVLEVSDPSRYDHGPKGRDDRWARANEICYEILCSKDVTERKMIQMAIADLNLRLGLNGRWGKRKAQCLVFIKTTKTQDTVQVSNKVRTISQLAFILDYSGKYPPTIDETGYTGTVNVGNDVSPANLVVELRKQGFDLIEAEREIDVLMITEEGYKK